MTVIAKNHFHPAPRAWERALRAILVHMQRQGAHPARCVVLLPYAQLMAQAQHQWARLVPDGFAPHFQTTRNWAQQLADFAPQGLDYAHDMARDRFTAAALLEKAGLGAQRNMLLPGLLDAAAQLAPLAAAIAPGARADWLAQQRAVLPLAGEGSALRYEAAVARLALEWVAASRHATDVLFAPGVRKAFDGLVLLQGFQPDPLGQALCAAWGAGGLALPLVEQGVEQGAEQGSADTAGPTAGPTTGQWALHCAQDAEDEAQRASACVLAHVQAGRTPVALASTDRALVRRVTALLAGSSVVAKDENGWTLATTRAAGALMLALRASAWNASSDAVLDWAQHTPALAAPEVRALERWLRKNALARWSSAAQRAQQGALDVPAALAHMEAWRAQLQAPRPLADWLAALRQVLQASGQWAALQADDAGARVLLELHLLDGLGDELADVEGAGRPLSLHDFTHWADQVLEATRFKPDWEQGEPAVVLLPLAQLLARPFAALVLPGCDEKRLQAAPEPPGAWTAQQRQSLGLPTRVSLEAAQRAAWAHALQTPWVDVLWRSSEGGEPLLASPLVLALPAALHAQAAPDTRIPRSVPPAPTPRPQPVGAQLPVQKLSASAYADLRQCPYRFYAQRQLGLKEADELEAEIDKSDFGTWLHAVLQRFHEALQAAPTQDGAVRAQMLDAAAEAARAQLGLSSSDFLPYASGWPQLREGYLAWLAGHEAAGHQFAQAEVKASQQLPLAQGSLELIGTLDRIDTTSDGTPVVMDYKTESASKTKTRVDKDGSEDTQLAFYAALQADHSAPLQAAYINVGERGETQTFAAQGIAALRGALLAGIRTDFDRIAQGAPLPALGEGSACDWCAVRGLCRRDFWRD